MGLFSGLKKMVKPLLATAAPMIGSAIGGPFGGLIGSAVGGMFSQGPAQDAAGAQRAAGQQMAQSFTPMNISGPFGGVNYQDGGLQMSLDPTLAGMQTNLFGQASDYFALGAPGSADDIAQQQMAREMALLQPYQQAQTNQMQNRLFNQGLMGATVGQGQMEGLFGQQQQAQMDAARRALAGGMNYQRSMFDMGQNALQAGYGLSTPLMQQAQLSMQGGGGLAQARQAGAQQGLQGDLTGAAADSMYQQTMMDAVKPALGGLFSDSANATNAFNTDYYADDYASPRGSFGADIYGEEETGWGYDF